MQFTRKRILFYLIVGLGIIGSVGVAIQGYTLRDAYYIYKEKGSGTQANPPPIVLLLKGQHAYGVSYTLKDTSCVNGTIDVYLNNTLVASQHLIKHAGLRETITSESFSYSFTPSDDVAMNITLHVMQGTGWDISITIDIALLPDVLLCVGSCSSIGFVICLVAVVHWDEMMKKNKKLSLTRENRNDDDKMSET